MKIYVVGGAIRDRLLGLPTQDLDYVVVGSSPEEMIARGFTPVGKDFPVFLHPKTKAEYALARTERKTAKGYKGFDFYADPSITLEQDLIRRDLTINAMAQAIDEEGRFNGDVIDPYGGQNDLKGKVLRHVSAAFVEDPLRLLRIARFAARFPGFKVHPETQKLLRGIVSSGELGALVGERVWQELSRLLMGDRPSDGIKVLADCEALSQFFLFDQSDANYSQILDRIDRAALTGFSLPQRCAMMYCQDEVRGATWAEKWRIPNDCRDYVSHLSYVYKLAILLNDPHPEPKVILELLDRGDVWRRPERFADLVNVVELTGLQIERLRHCVDMLQAIDTSSIVQLPISGKEIGERIHQARLDYLSRFLNS